MSISAYVLAGGKSSRMGTDKALLPFDGQTLLERALATLRQLTPHVAIAGGTPALARFAPVVPDLYPAQGPLGGIVSALAQSAHEHNLFLAVDMPFVPVEALRGLLATLIPGDAAVLAEYDGVSQPLCAVYTRTALPILQRELEGGNRRVRAAIEATDRVRYWPAPDAASAARWFSNLNTPADLQAAQTE